MQMIDKVALAIEGQDVLDDEDKYRSMAVAAIAAMREPSAAMISAGLVQSNRDDIDLTENEVAGIFQAMLDAALQEGKETGGLGGILLKPKGGAI
ncbi:hypothetical protein RHSP_45390 [Rhizobium freirei PRF 81]|uniref:Uncharacterized protein n=1 Tax=Rhizobium freirei PRF 81 TaxID=363754 RepID=N6V1A8_9HYPH|nr:hypothetical protein [Rhizobium freirei]ENN87645.1 hypothetical protein RHSP_45390 [Rhizobium freirei PRF 81]